MKKNIILYVTMRSNETVSVYVVTEPRPISLQVCRFSRQNVICRRDSLCLYVRAGKYTRRLPKNRRA
jgi:hypothetical protein